MSDVSQDAMHALVPLTVLNVIWWIHIELNKNVIVMMVIMKQENKYVMHVFKIVEFA